VKSHHPQTFRELQRTLAELREQVGAAPRLDHALERLERDLLPRTAGGTDYLVAGIVGPNNIGKSLLFNSLIGAQLSPSEPRGGATRQLVGAAAPALFEALISEPTLAQFPLAPVESDGTPLAAAKENAANPATLLFAKVPALPPGLMLIDTPDFDSVFVQNRAATESLLRVCDLALVMVNRNTYANAQVVDFLTDWLAHGRPWALVYNDAFLDHEITNEHVAEMVRAIQTEPLAVFVAPTDLELQVKGATKALVPHKLEGAERTSETLATWLQGEQRDAIKARALEASLAELRDDLAALLAELRTEAENALAIWNLVQRQTTEVARRVAAGAMPPDTFLEAFRRVADRRIPAWRRGLRAGQRRVRLALEGLSSRVLGGGPPRQERPVEVAALEAHELRTEWGPLIETLGRLLGPDAEVWSAARTDWARRIQTALAQAAEAGPPPASALQADDRTLSTFEAHCEDLITHEFEAAAQSRGRRAAEHLLQLGVDVLHALPMAAGVGTAIATGGVGADVASLAVGGLGSSMMERLTKHLGSGFARRARERWQDLRGAVLGERLAHRILGDLATELHNRATRHQSYAERLDALMESLS
jgi:hypothetical protein